MGWLLLSLLAALALLHTYIFYPAYLRYRTARLPAFVPPSDPVVFPFVSVLIAAYNEERVIVEKLRTVLDLDYPADRLRIYIGSDCSSDRTNALVSELATAHPRIQFHAFTERRGKPGVINELAEKAFAAQPPAADHLLLMTDANVLLEPTTLRRLVRHLAADASLALVDSHLVHTRGSQRGVGASERAYIGREVQLKHHEGRLWQRMIGPFGGCYLLRSTYFDPIPPRLLVDDFYLAMRVFERGGGAINDLEANSYEAVGEQMSEEFRRKARISTGNVQNLITFRQLWWPPVGALGFAFFSHKILRWLGPLWLLLLYTGAVGAYLSGAPGGLLLSAALTLLLIVLPLSDWLLQSLGIRLPFLRSWRYFVLMNVALGLGWLRFFGTEQRGIWTPPQRS